MKHRLRAAWRAFRGYAAAQDSRASSWAASGGSATAEIGIAAPGIARCARDAVRNDAYAARISVGSRFRWRWIFLKNCHAVKRVSCCAAY